MSARSHVQALRDPFHGHNALRAQLQRHFHLTGRADPKSLTFDFYPTCGVDKESMHMHSLVITFKDGDHITQDWKLFQNGKTKDSHPFALTRVKA